MNNLRNKIKRHFEGLRNAQEYSDFLKNLNYLNRKESLKIYNSLCLFWQQIGRRRYSRKLDKLHREFLIKRRKILNKISSVLKHD